MRIPKTNSKCAICLEDGDGFHFGAEACKACAAFFRRSISQKKHYACRGNGDCDVTINIRCMCRSCRFSKCLQVGMNPMGVQLKKESPKSPIPDLTPSIPTSSSSSSNPTRRSLLLLDLPESFNDSMPLLTRMRTNWQKLANARLVIHKNEGQSMFEERVSRAIDYKECINQGMKDVALTSDWISWCFEDFVKLPIDQKSALFRNFYTPYYMLEGAFMSHLNNRADAVFFPSGDYIDMNQLELFYKTIDFKQPLEKEQIDEIFKPSFLMHQRILIKPMMAENVDIFEYFSLTAYLLWDTTLEETSEECSRTGKQVKDQVMRELSFYMKNVKKIEEPGIRIAAIVNLLPAVFKSARRIQDDLEITKVFNIYKASEEFYDMVNGKFC
ncbi:hypothetical protein B9Z55_004450 [Caenorhabditis nigoni]|uniref:Nuclear receptor domain-containing protein n=1 Tax=Caenorhabditis nigoni TaxID=1611254 RepID=A0A2G5UWD9_9PELO|nr:hypothetical protein B9Z55_004450 [Caenorhabditis nigoni]